MAERLSLLAAIHSRWRAIAAVLALVVAVDAAAYFGYVRALARTSGDSEAILAKEQSKLSQLRAEVGGLEKITSKLACTRSDVDSIFEETLSSKEERMTSIQRELRDLARERRIDPEAITYTPTPVRGTGLVRFQVTFPLQGPYETLEDFIKAVESSKNFLIVESISMQEAQGANLNLNIQLVTYFQSPREEAAPETAAATPDAEAGGRT